MSQNVLAMSTLLKQRIKACNALNAMYVDTVDANEKTGLFNYTIKYYIYVDTVDTRHKYF